MTVGENLASIEWGFRRRRERKEKISDVGNVKVTQEKKGVMGTVSFAN